jgi:hypothetical protein
MQPKVIPAFVLFLGSYFPLSVILLLQDVKAKYWKLPICRPNNWVARCQLPSLENPWRSVTLFTVCATCLVALLLILKHVHNKHELKVVAYKDVPNDLINYVFPYVVAFMVLDLGDSGKYYGFWAFLAWMFVITYRSGQILMNPLLIVFGWQLYEVDAVIDKASETVRVISRFKPVKDKTFPYFGIQGIRILLKEDTHDDTTPAGSGTPTT